MSEWRVAGKTVLITGGAGFIGSSLALRLAQDNQVRILDLLRRNALEKTDLLDRPNVTLVRGDVCDYETVRQAIAGCDVVLHLASIVGVDTVMNNPVLTMQVALKGTMNVLEASLADGGVERVIDYSTSEVFGRMAYRVTEGDSTTLGAVGEARWTYAVSKLATEHLAYNYYKERGLPTVTIRPFNVYGPNQVVKSAVHLFIEQALNDAPLDVRNDGSQIRSWCYIDDLIDGTMLSIAHPDAVGHAFNIGNPRNTITIFNLAREIVRLVGSRSELRFVDWAFPDVELRIPSIDKARDVLGYHPKIDLEEGLMRTIAWYRSQ